MKIWEYCVAGAMQDQTHSELLNSYGAIGWECFAIDYRIAPTIFYFKREKSA